MNAETLARAQETKRKSSEMKRRLGIKSPMKSIRDKCIDCSGGSQADARNCVIPDCPLFPYRMGKNPKQDTMQVAQFDKKGALVGYEEIT